MSRWLKSVNHLLETLDGQAETVADSGVEQVGKFLETGRQAIGGPKRTGASASASAASQSQSQSQSQSDGYATDDDRNYEYEDEDEYEDEAEHEAEDDDVYEEVVVVDEEAVVDIQEDDLSDDDIIEEDLPDLDSEGGGGGLEAALVATTDPEDAVSLSLQRRQSHHDDATVSDMSSFSEYTEEIVLDDDDDVHQNENDKMVVVVDEDAGTAEDAPPRTPNRHDSHPQSVQEMVVASQHSTLDEGGGGGGGGDIGEQAPRIVPVSLTEGNIKSSLPPQSQSPHRTTTGLSSSVLQAKNHNNNNNSNNITHTHTSTSSQNPISPKVDESPRPPRRSVDGSNIPTAEVALLVEEFEAAVVVVATSSGGEIATVNDEAPPRLPARQASFPAKTKHSVDPVPPPPPPDAAVPVPLPPPPVVLSTTTAPVTGNTTQTIHSSSKAPPSKVGAKQQQQQQQSKAPSSSTMGVVAVNPTKVKEFQKVKDKYQALQAQFQRTTTELKTSQTKSSSLEKQVQTMNSKLDAANSEIHAQQDELRRAGERMEKDRLRAQEEREDILDEQEEELEQVTRNHQTQTDSLRNQYESQIAELTQQLEVEEMRRRQEGGDYTQDLQDALQRERDALKQLNLVNAEKAQHESNVSKLELQQTALQGKLESALSSVKVANEREREAEDKLDAAMSLHSRQTSQRQSREAELEKTIFELGTALTVAKQKQQNASLQQSRSTAIATDSESFKDKYMAAAEELETVRVQFNMETQRREALQEELNEISKERAEETSTAQARQRVHDRKVADLESTNTRLQSLIREHKGKGYNETSNGSANGKGVAEYSQELQTAKREIENLSSQLLRHQGIAENSKSEILALKGRLQAAISRAEKAETSLQAAQAAQSNRMSTNRLYEMESGGMASTGMRRRIKGGAARSRNRTIRSALQMSPGRSNHPAMEQVAITLDALDTWMVETGSFLRHEPLARLGFLLYLVTLHVWSFALVIFHTTEQPHGDFGSMDNNPRHWRAAAAAVQQQP